MTERGLSCEFYGRRECSGTGLCCWRLGRQANTSLPAREELTGIGGEGGEPVGEVDGAFTSWNTLKRTKPDWLRDRVINVLYQCALERHSDLADLPTACHVFRLSSRRRQSSGHLRPLPPNNQPPPPIGGFRFGVRDLFLSTTLLSRPPKRFWWRRLTTGFGIFTLEFGI